jgi:hypothetical protein
MATYAAGNDSPNGQVISLEYIAWWVFGVLGQQNDILTAQAQALADGVIVEQSDHDMSVDGIQRTINYRKISIENASTLHALACYRNEVDMRRSDVQNLIQ